MAMNLSNELLEITKRLGYIQLKSGVFYSSSSGNYLLRVVNGNLKEVITKNGNFEIKISNLDFGYSLNGKYFTTTEVYEEFKIQDLSELKLELKLEIPNNFDRIIVLSPDHTKKFIGEKVFEQIMDVSKNNKKNVLFDIVTENLLNFDIRGI
jgi:hypothetical protein